MDRSARPRQADIRRRAGAAFGLLCLLGTALSERAAAGVSAYLPLNLAPELESRLERALVLAGVPAMTRPIRVATVLAALPDTCKQDRVLCHEVRRDLAPYLAAAGLTAVGVEVGAGKRSTLPQPEQHGAPMNANWQAFGEAYARFGDHLLLNAGVVGYTGRTIPTGSMLSAGWDRLQVDVGYRDHWWSPFRLGAMLAGTEAPTLPSVTFSNVVPLTRAHVNYEVFLARMSYSRCIAYIGASATCGGAPGGGAVANTVSGYPELFGFHLDIEPAPGWSIGINRLMQFGGGPRPHSLSLLLKTFLNANKYDNATGAAAFNKQFGNEEFSVNSSLTLPTRMPMSLYIEYGGEDTFHGRNYRFGSGALAAGFYLPRLRPGVGLRYEYAERDSNWYVTSVYLNGLTNYGDSLGSWAGDWRVPGDGVGGQSHALELTWDRDNGQQLDLQYRVARNGSYTAGEQVLGGIVPHYKTGQDLALSLSQPWHALRVGAKLEGGRDESGSSFGRVAAFAHYTGLPGSRYREPLAGADAATATAPPAGDTAAQAEAAQTRRTVQYFVDFGLFSSKRDLEYDAGGPTPPLKTTEGSFHLGLGVRRAFSRSADFGTRIEFDNVKGRLYTALRAIDYRHHFGPTFAGSLFFGAARYDGPTPAYGWYGGAGVQWMNVFRNWDIGADYRRGDHLVRNKVLPTDTTRPTGYPNAFYNVTGETFYVSYRF